MNIKPTFFNFIHPRYWPTALGLSFLFFFSKLPFKSQRKIGSVLGKIAYVALRRRRHIANVNLKLCFPHLKESERNILIQKSFDSLGMGIIETGMAWWASDKKIENLSSLEGKENLEKALEKGKGVISLCGHFTTLEIAARIVGKQFRMRAIYREQKNKLFNFFMERGRKKIVDDIIDRNDPRAFINTLKENIPIYYAGDQDFGKKNSLFIPFFGVPAATITSIIRLAHMTGSPVVPVSHYRLDDKNQYVVTIHPALKNFPSGDLEADLLRANQIIEEMIRHKPEQYYWVHRRFKTRPEGEEKVY
jgi:KDO2-lipid IV(A) lauroyltransferase